MRALIAAWFAVVLGGDRRAPRATSPPEPFFLVMTPHMEFIRVYDRPGGYEKRLPYLGMIAVTYLNDKEAYLHGAVGKITRPMHAQALDMLRARGVTTVRFERHGVMKTIDLLQADKQTESRKTP